MGYPLIMSRQRGRPHKEPAEKFNTPFTILLRTDQVLLLEKAAETMGKQKTVWCRNVIMAAVAGVLGVTVLPNSLVLTAKAPPANPDPQKATIPPNLSDGSVDGVKAFADQLVEAASLGVKCAASLATVIPPTYGMSDKRIASCDMASGHDETVVWKQTNKGMVQEARDFTDQLMNAIKKANPQSFQEAHEFVERIPEKYPSTAMTEFLEAIHKEQVAALENNPTTETPTAGRE